MACSNHHDRLIRGLCVLKGKHFLLDRTLCLVNNYCTTYKCYGNFTLQSREHDVRDITKLRRKTYAESAGAVCITSAAHLRAGERSGSPPDTENIPKVAKDFLTICSRLRLK